MVFDLASSPLASLAERPMRGVQGVDFERVAGERRQQVGLHVLLPEGSDLVGRLEIPVEAGSASKQADAKGLDLFNARHAAEFRGGVFIIERVEIAQERTGDRRRDVDAAEMLFLVGRVVKNAGAVHFRLDGENIDAGLADPVDHSEAVEGPTHVRPLARRNQPLVAIGQFLAPISETRIVAKRRRRRNSRKRCIRSMRSTSVVEETRRSPKMRSSPN